MSDTRKCKMCGRPYATMHCLPMEDWEEICGDYSLLCIPCIDFLAHKSGISLAWEGTIHSKEGDDDQQAAEKLLAKVDEMDLANRAGEIEIETTRLVNLICGVALGTAGVPGPDNSLQDAYWKLSVAANSLERVADEAGVSICRYRDGCQDVEKQAIIDRFNETFSDREDARGVLCQILRQHFDFQPNTAADVRALAATVNHLLEERDD